MDQGFWRQRWRDRRLGWHLSEVHPLLIKYFPRFNLTVGNRVFVPLCGKSVDMRWLADRGLRVIGNEISDIAIEDFFCSQGLQPTRTKFGKLVSWQAGPYTLYEGDFFELTPAQMSGVKFIHDRAALIALPKEGESGRKAYLRQMRKLFSADVQTLLITLDYDQTILTGPPYSVGYEEVIWQYAFDHIIEFLSARNILDQESRFRERGLRQLTEWAFMMTRYEPAYAAFSGPPRNF